ncbi:hypothetical protein DMUE_4308 [Dictyocoela muelleri]|nr:hypothetical protein DMUE_4308 [Dictyocoela muelleri]
MVERGTCRCYIQVVKDKKCKTLENIISKCIKSTIIFTDHAKAYNKFSDICFKNFTVCYKTNFVDSETGTYTQIIKSLWNHFRKKGHLKYEITKTRLGNYYQVFCFFINHKDMRF